MLMNQTADDAEALILILRRQLLEVVKQGGAWRVEIHRNKEDVNEPGVKNRQVKAGKLETIVIQILER